MRASRAPQNAGAGQVADAPDGGVVPVLLCSGPVAQTVQVSGNLPCAKALVDVLSQVGILAARPFPLLYGFRARNTVYSVFKLHERHKVRAFH